MNTEPSSQSRLLGNGWINRTSAAIRHSNIYLNLKLPWWLSCKESASQCMRRGFDPWVQKIPQRRKWQPTPVFLSGKSHGQRNLVGYSPWGSWWVRHDLVSKQQFTYMQFKNRIKQERVKKTSWSSATVEDYYCIWQNFKFKRNVSFSRTRWQLSWENL